MLYSQCGSCFIIGKTETKKFLKALTFFKSSFSNRACDSQCSRIHTKQKR